MWQDSFAAALDDLDSDVPDFLVGKRGGNPQRRFSVYRNNVYSSLVNALVEGFPVVVRLVGVEFFKAMASAYAQSCLPNSKIMCFYGSKFGAFIDTFEPVASLPYLGDVARLEYAMQCALHAADTPPIKTDWQSTLDAELLPRLILTLHSSVQLVSSPYPIHSIWLNNSNIASDLDIPACGEDTLVWRQDMNVRSMTLPSGGYAFFSALLSKNSIAAASEAAIESGGSDHLTMLMPLCLQLSTHIEGP